MKRLDVQKLHTGLQLDFGLEYPQERVHSNVVVTHLLSRSGLPLNVGWLNNNKAVLQGEYNYALTTYANEPKTLHHQLVLAQEFGKPYGLYYLEDADEFVSGSRSRTTIRDLEVLKLYDVDATIHDLMIGAYVLDLSTGHRFNQFACDRAYEIEEVRRFGRLLIEAGNYVSEVDEKMLERYAQLDIPVFHDLM